MATSQRETIPVCDVSILTTKRVDLVKQIVLENVMPSVKPFLLYTQVNAIYAERGQDEKIRSMLDILQRQVNGKEYRAFNAFILSLAGTQPELFNTICGREPTVSESDFCMKEVSQIMKTTIDSSKHCTDSELDEQIEFQYEYVELSMVDKAAEEQELDSHGGKLPHEYSLHLDKVHSRDRNISACNVLGREDKQYKKVSIYGRGGVGKSTTFQFLAKQWALGRWAAGFTMLFLLQLRFITTQVIAMSTVELLQLYGLYDFPDHSDSTPFTSWLKNCTSRILILIDGLDEIPSFADKMKNTPRIYDVLQKAHPVDLCINILRGDLLPVCTVISASRPFAGLSQLPTDAKAEILGLTSAKVAEYVERRHPHHVKNIMSVLSKNPILLSVCSITFYCMLITRLLSEGVTILDEDVATYSRLMAFIVFNYCSRKLTDSSFLMDATSYFSKLAHLAHSGIFELEDNKGLAKIVFDEDDLIKSNIKQEDLDNMKKTGIMQVTRKKIGRHESWTAEFFHLSAQELLAVAHFLSHPPFPNHKLNQLFHSGQFNLALQFIFGSHFDRNNSWIRKICTAVSAQFESEGIEPELSSFIDSILDQKLKVCQLIHEGQWEEKAREVVSHIAPGGKLVIHHTTMTAIDLLAVDYVCQVGALSSITLWMVHADDTFVNVLLSPLCEHHWETLQVLDLEGNNIGDAGAAAIAESLCKHNNHTLQVLHLYGNSIGAAGAAAIADSLCKHNNHTLQVLNLGRNNIGDAGAAAIADSLCKHNNHTLQVLNLAGNSIGAAGAAAIADSLCKGDPESVSNVHTLRTLNITSNHIGDEGAKALGRMLTNNDNLQTLEVRNNEIGEEGVKALVSGVKYNTGLKILGMGFSHPASIGAEAIGEMLQYNTCLQELDLDLCRLHDDKVQVLAAGLHRNTTLTELKLSGNEIGDKGAASLATMLYHNTGLQKLDMPHNQIGDKGGQAIAEGMVHNTSLEELDISHNKIGDAGALAIAAAFCSTAAGTDLVQTQVHLPVVLESAEVTCLIPMNTEGSVEVRRWNWCGCLSSLCRESAWVDLTQYSTTEGAGVDLTQCSTTEGAGIDLPQYSTTEGAGVDLSQYSTTEGAGEDLTQYNTTLRKLVVSYNGIGPDSKKALADVRQHNPHLNITY